MSDLGDGLKEIGKAASGYAKAVAYSEGPINEVFLSHRMKRLLRGKGASFTTVLGDVVIDAVANKLKVTSISSDTDERTAALAAVDEANLMGLRRPMVMRTALQMGDCYVIAWPVVDADGTAVPGAVEVGVNDPRTCRVLYNPDRAGVPRLAIRKWTTAGDRVRVDLLYPPADGERGRVERYISRTASKRATSELDFEPWRGEDGDEEPVEEHDHGWPVFHFTTAPVPGEYGVPEHKPFYATQDKLNKLSVTHMAGVDYYSLPQRYALMEADADTSEAALLDDDEFAIPGAETEEDRTGRRSEDAVSSLSAEPGSLWYQAGVKGFGQFDTADPRAFLDPMSWYLREGAAASSTPFHLFDLPGEVPSGESLKTANAPLDEKSGDRRDSFHAVWTAFYRYVLSLLGEEAAPVHIQWAPIESTDETTKLGQAEQRQRVGVPDEQTLTELGYPPNQVQAWIAAGSANLPAKIELLAKLASAMADFSAASAAGLIDQSTVSALVAKLTADVVDDDRAD